MGSMVDVLKKMNDRDGGRTADAQVENRAPGAVEIIQPPRFLDRSTHQPAVNDPVVGLPADGPQRAAEFANIDPALIAFHEPSAAITEQYRSVRARLMSQNLTGESQLIAITSAVPLEGKTITTVNLGLVMAESRELRVAILDADLRRASLGRTLGYRGGPGLADLLLGRATMSEVIHKTPAPNLDLIPAGRTNGIKIAEQLAGGSTRGVFDMLRTHYDYVLIDTPPATTVSDVCTIAPLCNHILVVILMNRTPEPLVRRTVRLIQTNNGRICGAILSRYQDRRARYYYDYYRYYYRRDPSDNVIA